MANQYIDQFITQLMSDAGLDTLSQNFKDDYRQRLADQAERRMGIEAVKLLDDDGKVAYAELLQKSEEKDPTPEEMVEFFRKNIKISSIVVKSFEVIKMKITC